MRKTVLLILMILIFSTSALFASTHEPVSVKVDDLFIAGEAPSYLIDGRVYVVSRYFTETLGGQVFWNEEKQVVSVRDSGLEVDLFMDGSEAIVNGESRAIDSVPFISRGRTYVPLSFLTDLYGFETNWNAEEATVTVETDLELTAEKKYLSEEPPIDEEDLYWLSKIVQVETNGSYDMKIGVANVVLNRVKDPRFANTVKGVIFEISGGYVQFPPAHKASFESVEPTDRSIEAARNALLGENNVEDCLYFNYKPWTHMSDRLYKVIDGEYFYK
jgi:hypothetical protein